MRRHPKDWEAQDVGKQNMLGRKRCLEGQDAGKQKVSGCTDAGKKSSRMQQILC